MLLDVERVQQGADLLLAVARRDPGRVLHGPEAEEAQALGELRALDAAVLRDRVPHDGPRVRRGAPRPNVKMRRSPSASSSCARELSV